MPNRWRQSVDVGCQFHGVAWRVAALARCGERYRHSAAAGIGTPTEAMAAAERGYTFLKFFPAEALGGARS